DVEPQAIELTHVDRVVARAEGILEAALGQAALHRHLAALEAGDGSVVAGACLLTLDALARGLAQARADAASQAFLVLVRTWRVLECVQCRSHGYSAASTLTMCETLRIIPRIAGVSFRITVLCIFVSPSPLIVSFWGSGRLMPERMSVTFSLRAITPKSP